jgi:hypothetical protein
MAGKKTSIISILASLVLLSTLAGVNAQETIQVTVATVDMDGSSLEGQVHVNVPPYVWQNSEHTYELVNGGFKQFSGSWGGLGSGAVSFECFKDTTYSIDALTQELTRASTPGVNRVNIVFEPIQVTMATVDMDGSSLEGQVHVNVPPYVWQNSGYNYELANGGFKQFSGSWGGLGSGAVSFECFKDTTYSIDALTQELTSQTTLGTNRVNIVFIVATPTPPGTDVIVQPVDETTGETLATLSFDNVTEGGMTTLTSTTPSENQGPPQGFRFGAPPVMFDITTTATFEGNVEVCFDYSGMGFHNESSLKLFHSSDGSDWIDVTTSLDTENDVICGIVTSFSFFGVFETADPVVMLEELAQQATALNLAQGIENSLHAKLDTALQILEDSNENNDVAAVNALGAFINAVEAQRGKKISAGDADDLIAAAQEIVDCLRAG